MHAVFQRSPPIVLPQGFARHISMKNVLTTPTAEHVSYLKQLFDLPQKLQGMAMREQMKKDFPHPRDHLSVEQIEGQISKFARQKKNPIIHAAPLILPND